VISSISHVVKDNANVTVSEDVQKVAVLLHIVVKTLKQPLGSCLDNVNKNI
jgi:hypothetical protein